MNATTTPAETQYTWSDMPDHLQAYVLGAHVVMLKTKKVAALKRIFDLGNPQIVIGANQETHKSYCRVEGEESVKVINLLIREYL